LQIADRGLSEREPVSFVFQSAILNPQSEIKSPGEFCSLAGACLRFPVPALSGGPFGEWCCSYTDYDNAENNRYRNAQADDPLPVSSEGQKLKRILLKASGHKIDD
jgi:hypothetical protein